jgi:predicted RNA-binding Zn-ribbon protein involved in translation (DUF1610 family)
MGSIMTCPDCGAQITDGTDMVAGRRVHRLTVGDDAVTIDRTGTVTLWRCGDCDIVLGVS